MKFTGAPLEQALRLATVNPAAMTGLGNQVGSVAVGRVASLVAVDRAGKLVGSVVNGQAVAAAR
jgi:imidazolonepropionase-like amidohydrolase